MGNLFKTKQLQTTREELRKKACAQMVSGFKAASIGGEQEGAFEQSFAQLAFTYVQDKAPKLFDYLVGFQLVDRNDDANKAVGVFGFNLNKQWLYAPVFFLNGDVKGHELLYIKNKDQFVPMKENWINYLMSQRPRVLGEGSTQSTEELGIRSPDFRRLSTPPQAGKYASADWIDGFMPFYAAAVTDPSLTLKKFAGLSQRLDLKELFETSLPAIKVAMDWMDEYPFLKQAMDRFYGTDVLRNALCGIKKKADIAQSVLRKEEKQASVRKGILNKQAAADKPKVTITVDKDTVTTENLSEPDKEKLLRDGYLIEDHREGDEVSVAYNTQIPFEVVNPSESGIYQVLTKPGQFERCLVLSNPHSANGRVNSVTVIRLGDDKNWLNADRSRIWVKEDTETKESYTNWVADQSDGDPSVGGVYVALSATGQGSVPFRVIKKTGDNKYQIAEADHVDYKFERSSDLPRLGTNGHACSISCGDSTLVINGHAGSRIKSSGGTLYVPTSSKLLSIKKPAKDNDDGYVSSYLSSSGDKDSPAIEPGDLADIQMEIMRKTAELKVWTDGEEVIINRNRMSKLAGLFHLVRDYNFREKVAEQILQEADRHGGCKYRVKLANSPFLSDTQPTAPFPYDSSTYGSDNYNGVRTQEPYADYAEVPSMSSANTDPTVYDNSMPMTPDSQMLGLAQNAADTGQKDVFDVSMVSSLLKATRQDSIVDRYLGDLMKALDRSGRLLFNFLWHNDDFADRFGKADLPELEDSLRNTFESIGDLVLFLKAKTVEPFMNGNYSEPSISESARN